MNSSETYKSQRGARAAIFMKYSLSKFGQNKKTIILSATLIFLALLLIASILIKNSGPKKISDTTLKCSGCNVILISIDTLGAKHLGLYGSGKATSPKLDSLVASNSIVYDQAISQASWTLPSHAAMLTGKYPEALNIASPTDALPKDTQTIASSLQKNGYQTHAISNGAFVQPHWGFDKGFDTFDGNVDPDKWEDSPEIFQKGSVWIKQQTGGPFFLFLHSFYPHDPYIPNQSASDLFNGELPAPVDISHIVSINDQAPDTNATSAARDAYDAQIPQIDTDLYNFIEDLKQQNQYNNTVVIITSDHGEEFGEHGSTGIHGVKLYEETMNVPLIFFVPGTKAQRVDTPVEVRSIPSTILGLLDLPAEPSFEAINILPQNLINNSGEMVIMSSTNLPENSYRGLKDSYGKIEQLNQSPLVVPNPISINPRLKSARIKNWKVIYGETGIEIYNLASDPMEQTNLKDTYSRLPTQDVATINKLRQILGVPE